MKTKTVFICQECGTQSSGWLGRCPGCQNWNTFVEESLQPMEGTARPALTCKEEPMLLNDVVSHGEDRFCTGNDELDRVLGGGIVPASVILLGGDPGIGKSTLALQAGCLLSHKGHKIFYISGEESVKQAKMRADRLLEKDSSKLYIVNQIDLDVIFQHIEKLKPDVVILDSIQVVFQKDISSSPGSVSQVRECASLLTQFAKTRGVAVIMIGHVTKEGMLAGPRVLEHLVDTVLYFEGERYSMYRVLRATKNRFGSTNEIGVFEMTAEGLRQVKNPSEIFLSERLHDASGSVVVPILEGTRPFLVEIQGLVSRASFGVTRQKAQGFDANRLSLLAAVLEKKIGLSLQDKDIFLNVVGGVKVVDPAADLAVTLAIATALLDRKIPHDVVVLGEVGLSSEVRSISHVLTRINEAQKLGFQRCILPKNNLKSKEIRKEKIECVGVETVKQALDIL